MIDRDDIVGDAAESVASMTDDLDLVVAFDGQGNAGDGIKGDRMTETKGQNEVGTLKTDAVTGTNELEFLGEAGSDAKNGVVGEGTTQAVIGTGKFVFTVTSKFQVSPFNFGGDLFGKGDDKVTLWAGEIEFAVFDLNAHNLVILLQILFYGDLVSRIILRYMRRQFQDTMLALPAQKTDNFHFIRRQFFDCRSQ